MAVLEKYHYQVEFTISYDKTTVLRIGSLKNSDAKLFTQKVLNWTSDKINVLGIKVANDTDKVVRDNYELLLAKVCYCNGKTMD